MKTKHGKKKNFLDIKGLVSSIQRAEGNPDCYRSGNVNCDQFECSWRGHCIENGDKREHV